MSSVKRKNERDVFGPARLAAVVVLSVSRLRRAFMGFHEDSPEADTQGRHEGHGQIMTGSALINLKLLIFGRRKDTELPKAIGGENRGTHGEQLG